MLPWLGGGAELAPTAIDESEYVDEVDSELCEVMNRVYEDDDASDETGLEVVHGESLSPRLEIDAEDLETEQRDRCE